MRSISRNRGRGKSKMVTSVLKPREMSIWEGNIPDRGKSKWKSTGVEIRLAHIRSSVAGSVADKKARLRER